MRSSGSNITEQFSGDSISPRGAEKAKDTIKALRAENAKLRSALHRIGLPLAQITYCRDGHEDAVLIARAALGGEND